MNLLTPPAARRTFIGAAASLCLLAASGAAIAQAAWPTKTVRIVVDFAPGGTTDVMARVIAQGLTEALGQAVIVDNKPGAGGSIAAGEVIKAAADGYTLLVVPTSVETANPSLFKSNIVGLWVPNRTPAEVGARLVRELNKVPATSAVKQRFGDLGAEPVPLDTAEFKKLPAQEGKTLSALIKDRKIIVE